MSDEHHKNSVAPQSTHLTTTIDQENLHHNYARTIRRIIWKLDRRLIPFLALLEFSSFLNRISIGHAKLNDMDKDLQLSKAQGNWGISLFYIGLLLFDIPSILFLRIIGPTCYLSLSMIAWGSITVGMAFVKNARELFAVRFLLGVVEAGFFPGIIIYFSMWYRKQEQTMRITIFFAAAILSGAFGAILAYGITKMDGIGGLHGWQWIFVLEGLPIIPLGFIVCFFLGNIPDTVQWLNNSQKEILTNMLRDDAGVTNSEDESSARLSWRQVGYAFSDWRIYLYAVLVAGNLAVFKCLTTYLPILFLGMNYTKEDAQLISGSPYIFGCICTILGGFSSSRKNEHGYHLSFFLSVCVLGFVLMATLAEQGKAAMYVSVCLTCCGTFTAFPILLSWLTKNVGGHTKRAMAVGFVMAVGQIGGVVAPVIYRDEDAPDYRRGHIICGIITIVTLLITLILRFSLKKDNERRKNLTEAERANKLQIKELCDWHPDIYYIL